MKDGRMTAWQRSVRGLALVALASLGVAGCSKSEPEPPEMNMAVQELEPTPEPTPTAEPTPVAMPTPEPSNDTAALPPPEAPAPDAQMMDDASATGMTARTDRSGEDADAAPAETKRRD
jgi:hypothetical protein